MGIRSNLNANFDVDIASEFLDHYSMMVESMEVMIIDLSKQYMRKRSIDKLFRVFHNIKSASSFLAIQPMSRLATLVKDELGELRSNTKPVNEETIDWLLAIRDMFTVWEQNFVHDEALAKIHFSLLKLPDLEK